MKRRTFLKLGSGTALSRRTLAACGHDSATTRLPRGGPTWRRSRRRQAGPAGRPAVGRQRGHRLDRTGPAAIRVARPGPPMGARSFADPVHLHVQRVVRLRRGGAADAAPARPPRRPRRMHRHQQGDGHELCRLCRAVSDQFPSQTATFDLYMMQLGYDSAAGGSGDAGQPGGDRRGGGAGRDRLLPQRRRQPAGRPDAERRPVCRLHRLRARRIRR